MLAAVGAATALGVRPSGRIDVRFSSMRGEVVELPGGVTIVNDCYNANPMSMRAALTELSRRAPEGRRVAVLGDMLELGPEEADYHRQAGRLVKRLGWDVLVAVGPLARHLAELRVERAHARIGHERDCDSTAQRPWRRAGEPGAETPYGNPVRGSSDDGNIQHG